MAIRRLILHVGYFKTGSSALQHQLAFHARTLQEDGVIYPRDSELDPVRGRNINHSALPLQLFYEAGAHVPQYYADSRAFQKYLSRKSKPAWDIVVGEARDAREARRGSADTLILSAEHFTRFIDRVDPSVPKRLIKEIGADSTTIVCYLRRPDRYLESWYNQLIKGGRRVSRLSESIDQWLGTSHTDFDRVVGYWSDVVDGERLILRNYDQLTSGDIVADFADATDLNIPLERDHARDANPRIDNNFIEYARRWSSLRGRPDPRLWRLLETMVQDPALPPRRPVAVLDAAARRELYDYVTGVNQRLGQLVGQPDGFFDDLDDMLEVPPDSISDLEAFELWAPYIDEAINKSASVSSLRLRLSRRIPKRIRHRVPQRWRKALAGQR